MANTNQNHAKIISLHERDLRFEALMPPHTDYLPDEPFVDREIPFIAYRDPVEIGGAIFNATTRIPLEITSPHRKLVAHGYTASESAYNGFANALAQQGNVVTTYEPPRTQHIFKALHPAHSSNPSLLLCQALWGAYKASAKRTDIEGVTELDTKADIIGHSMGGKAATSLALRHPELVRTVLLNEAAGLEKQNLLMMIARLKDFKKELPGTDLEVLLGSLRYITKNPLRTAAEGIAVATADIRGPVASLKNKGVKSAILVGRADNLIPAVAVARGSGVDVADRFGVYSDKTADHLYLQKCPLAAAAAQLQMLNLLHDSVALPVSDKARAA